MRFKDFFLFESAEFNTPYGAAYEIATVLHTHFLSGAKNNKDPNYTKKIEDLKEKGRNAFDVLPENLRQTALSSAKKSAEAYLSSLEKNFGISSIEINEVHHTPSGIDSHVGSKVDRKLNPHDMIVKTKAGKIHGASLKAKTGTLSNNTTGAIDRVLGTDLTSHYDKARESLGGKEAIKKMGKTEAVTKATHRAQESAANEYTSSFNKLPHEEKISHLNVVLKAARGDVDYDYVNGQKGVSIPSHKLDHVNKLQNAESITAKRSKSIGGVHIVDHKDNVIAKVEHRPTHSGITSPQVNFKI